MIWRARERSRTRRTGTIKGTTGTTRASGSSSSGTPDRKETKQIAQQLEAEHRQIALGTKPAPTAPARHRKRPFLEVVAEYVAWGKAFGRADGKGWTARWAGDVDGCLRKWAETLSIETLADLDGILPRVEATLQQLAEKDYAGRTLGSYVKPLIAFCKWCIGHGYLVANPLENLAKIDQTAETERRAMTGDEIGKLFSVAPGWRRLAYAVAIVTGLRLSELRRLDRIDLDIENSRLCLRWKLTKNRKPATQYLPAKLAAALAAFADSGAPKRLYERARTQRALPESPLLFVPSHLLRRFDVDLERARIAKETPEGKLDFHALRATGITLCAEAGANVKELQAMARHADPKLTFGIYAKARDPRMAELAEKVGGVLPVSGAESATEVHCEGQGPHKLLPERELCEEGLRRRDGGPRFIQACRPCATVQNRRIRTCLSSCTLIVVLIIGQAGGSASESDGAFPAVAGIG